MALCEKILIAGFSGAGKTSLLQAANKTAPDDWVNFSDLDQLILKNHGHGEKSLADLIENKGWEAFRLWERQELEGWLKEEGKGVLALGGGTLSSIIMETYGKSRKIKMLYLETPFDVCWNRLVSDQQEMRPLIKLGEFELHQLFESREVLFKQIEWKLAGNESLSENVEKFWEHVGKCK